jgi:hypothetical protein
MHSEQPHNCYLFLIIIAAVKSRTMRWTDHITRTGGNRLVTNLRPKTKVIRLLWRSRFYWQKNIEMGVKEIRHGGARLIELIKDGIQRGNKFAVSIKEEKYFE